METGLVDHVREFLLELGQGFAFVGRQVLLEVGRDEFYCDLLFYHLKLRRFLCTNRRGTSGLLCGSPASSSTPQLAPFTSPCRLEEILYDKLPCTQRLATITVDGTERLLVDGDTVQVGQRLLEGNPDPHEVLRDRAASGPPADSANLNVGVSTLIARMKSFT